jgi:SAM-dependent methyltransferase
MLPEKDHVRACRESADRLQLPNIVLKQGILNQIPFTDQSFDLILLHCSIREMKYFYEVLAEVHRVARSDAQFLLCMLMKDALQEYFSIVENILNVLNMASELKALHTMKKSRMRSLQESEFVLKHLGFRISEIILGQYSLTFLDGRSFLNHQFAKKELIPDWKLFLNGSNKQDFFQQLESNLNKKTTAHGSLTVHMPFVVIDAGVGVTDLE